MYNFPELKYESFCKVCQLRDSHPQILAYIHKLRIEENKGWSFILNEIKSLGVEDVHLPSMSSIRRHFLKLHVDISKYQWDPDALSVKSRILSSSRLNKDYKELVKRRENVRTPIQDIRTELDTLWDMQNTMLDLSSRMDTDFNVFFNEAGGVNKDAVNAWVNLINANRQVISEIRKIRESEQLTSFILQRLLITYTKRIGTPILDFVFEMAQELKQLKGSQRIQDRAEYFLNEGFLSLLVDTADETLSDIRSEFKLPNR